MSPIILKSDPDNWRFGSSAKKNGLVFAEYAAIRKQNKNATNSGFRL